LISAGLELCYLTGDRFISAMGRDITKTQEIIKIMPFKDISIVGPYQVSN